MLIALCVWFNLILAHFTEKELQFREVKSLCSSQTPRPVLLNVWPNDVVGLDV